MGEESLGVESGPHGNRHLRDPKDLRTNVNSKGNREPTEGTLASDSLGRN